MIVPALAHGKLALRHVLPVPPPHNMGKTQLGSTSDRLESLFEMKISPL